MRPINLCYKVTYVSFLKDAILHQNISPLLPIDDPLMVDTITTLPPGLSLNNTIGALEIGIIISAIAFGILTLQVVQYYRNYDKDKWYLKLLV